MRTLKLVKLPRPADTLADLANFHRYLKATLFPLIDALRAAELIDTWDFLTHNGAAPSIDLRLWVRDESFATEVKKLLKERGLPDQLEDCAPAETQAQRELLLTLLCQSAGQIRTLLSDPSGLRTIEEVVHWLLNQYGMSNQYESAWHLRQAEVWGAINS